MCIVNASNATIPDGNDTAWSVDEATWDERFDVGGCFAKIYIHCTSCWCLSYSFSSLCKSMLLVLIYASMDFNCDYLISFGINTLVIMEMIVDFNTQY